MDRSLNREIFRLALPSILANITIPLVGIVDTAIAGHLPGDAPVFIGAIALGSLVFNLIYMIFGFLRTGVGGLTAQAFGRRDRTDCARTFARAETIALAAAAAVLMLQSPILKVFNLALDGTPQVKEWMSEYFLVRIWAAPATLSLMVFSGWFVGMQDSRSSMWKDLIVNGVNMAASFALAFGADMGFMGIVWGTVIAQWSGLVYCAAVAATRYKTIFSRLTPEVIKTLFRGSDMRGFFSMNADLVGRSIGFIVIYIGYTAIAARYGDTILACSSILMQMLMLFSYFSDGFAYAGEALTGRFIGEKNSAQLKRSIRYIFFWGACVALVFTAFYALAGGAMMSLLTSDVSLAQECLRFRLWMIIMPSVGCAAFIFDGIYLGATASKDVRNAMLGAMVCFLGLWYLLRCTLDPTGDAALHCLMAAYYAHLLFRTLYLTFRRNRIST